MFKDWKLDFKKLFIAITVLFLIVSNFYLLITLNKNIQLIGQMNIIIIQQNELILKNTKGKWI